MEGKFPKDWDEPDNPTGQEEVQKIINWCKSHLKNVFTLKYMEDLDPDENCKVLNISSSNYWMLIHQARLQIRDCVEKYWFKS